MSGNTAGRFRFVVLPESFAIHHLPPDARVDPAALAAASWYSITRTDEELSIVAPDGVDPGPAERESGWSCLRIADRLDFGMVGVIASVARVLADAGVSIFTISTWDTDYFLVKSAALTRAIHALEAAGHTVLRA